MSQTIPYLNKLSRTISYLNSLSRTIPYLNTLTQTKPYRNTLTRTIPYLNILCRTVLYLNTLSRTIPYLNALSRTIPYLNTLPSTAKKLRQPTRNDSYVTRDLSARVEVPSGFSARVGPLKPILIHRELHPPPSDDFITLLWLFTKLIDAQLFSNSTSSSWVTKEKSP